MRTSQSSIGGPKINWTGCLRCAADLVARQVAAIVTPGGVASTLAAKSATTTIPIVFVVGEDPVRLGLVASLARPGGNLTGVNFFNTELTAKRLQLLREMLPAATRVAVLVNPVNASNTETTLKDIEPAAHTIGIDVQIFNAANAREINDAFVSLARTVNQTRCLSGLTRSSTAGGSKLFTWPRTIDCQRHTAIETMPRPAV